MAQPRQAGRLKSETAKPAVTLREILDARTGPATRILWNVVDHPKTKVVGTKVSDMWVKQREGAGVKQDAWLAEVRAYVEERLETSELPAPDEHGDIWYEVNTFTPL